MKEQVKTFTRTIAGRNLTIEVGKLANQTNGSCTVQYGESKVLATAVMGKRPQEGLDYFPLLVDYEERLYAAGKIKGSRFIKREGRPTDEAVLTTRLIDRSIRPLFNMDIRNEVQVVITALSVDGENDTDFPALIAASCALAISDIPWEGPIAGINIAEVDGNIVINPTNEDSSRATMSAFFSGLKDRVMMIECLGYQVPEETFLKAHDTAMVCISELVECIREVQNSVGKTKTIPAYAMTTKEEQEKEKQIRERVTLFTDGVNMRNIWTSVSKVERDVAMTGFLSKFDETLHAEGKDETFRRKAEKILIEVIEHDAGRMVLGEKQRVDGRKLDEIRELSSDVSVLPRTHGSGLFNRGETQVLSVVTLGAPGDEQLLDGMEENGSKRYMHHYNFPGFCVGEVRPMRSPGRREIGHGALAEKAIIPVLPTKEQFPYTIRVVSEVLSSNGSSSQASVCGSTLALMDAGVPILAPVAGIAMGMVTDEKTGDFEIITDIQGIEDHAGEMDFKVAGTRKGITAIQLDVKNYGLSRNMTQKTLEQARIARGKILDVMEQTIAAPRPTLSPYAPKIFTHKIDPEKIRDVIGKGGETINKIIDENGGRDVIKIDIEDDGLVMVTTRDQKAGENVIEIIKNLTRKIAVGEEFTGIITKIVTDRNSGTEIGAIVELVPGQDGMVHISEFSNERINRVSDVVKIGDKLSVKVLDVDVERGRIVLSHKVIANGGKVDVKNVRTRNRGGRDNRNGRNPRNQRGNGYR